MPQAPSRWTPTTKRVVVASLVALAVLLAVALQHIVAPFLWAFVVGYVLLPAVAFLERRFRLRRGIAAAIVFLLLVGTIALVIRLVAPIAAAEVRDAQRALPAIVRNALNTVADWLRGLEMGDLDVVVLGQGTQEIAQGAGRALVSVATAAGRLALELLLFLVAVLFVLRDAPRFGAFLARQVPRPHRREILHIAQQVDQLIARYIRGQLLLVGLMSTVTAVGLSLLGVPYSVVLGLVTGVLELIPIAGPITAGAIASVVALGHPNPFGWAQLGYVGAVVAMYTVLRHAEDYFVVPSVIGRIVHLHPLVVIFSVLAGGAIFGLLGVLLAVPAAATIRLVLVYVMAKLRDEDPLAELEREIEAEVADVTAAREGARAQVAGEGAP
jgi:predicted PurR-regulated permease PerM